MRTKIIGGMAAIAERVATLDKVIDSIAGQLDTLYIYLNDFKQVPPFLSVYKNVVPILASTARGDLNANGKIYFLQYETKGLALTLDDDYIYPPDYVLTFIKTFELFEKPIMACVHGSVLLSKQNYYYERAIAFDGRKAQPYNNIATLCGSGTAAFPIEFIHGTEHDFFSEIYVDLQLSLMAHKCKMPLVSIARIDGWLHHLGYCGLFEATSRNVSHHTNILKKNLQFIQWDYIRDIWKNFLSALTRGDMADIVAKLRLSPASIDFLNGHGYYNNRSAWLQLGKLVEFAENLHRTEEPRAQKPANEGFIEDQAGSQENHE